MPGAGVGCAARHTTGANEGSLEPRENSRNGGSRSIHVADRPKANKVRCAIRTNKACALRGIRFKRGINRMPYSIFYFTCSLRPPKMVSAKDLRRAQLRARAFVGGVELRLER